MRLVIPLALLVTLAFSVAPIEAKTKRKALKSCLAALDAAESVGVDSELYEENAKRCRTGVNTPEKVSKSKGYTPVPTDFALEVTTLGQDCFGEAGCNVTFSVELSYVGSQSLDEDKTYRLVYEIRGGEDLKIGSLTLTGDGQYRSPAEDFISTPPNPVLTAVVTKVIEE